MKTFKEFILESQWMYHGTTNEFDIPEPNRDNYSMDRAIGTHFSSDKSLAKKFSDGLYNKKPINKGLMIRTLSPTKSKIQKVPQGPREWDAQSIEHYIANTVFSHPEGKEFFKEFIKTHVNNHSGIINDDKAEEMYNRLSSGNHINDKKFGPFANRANNINSFLKNTGSINTAFGSSESGKNRKRKIIDKFLDIMKERGIKGLSYRNTSPMETENVVGKKCYVLFHPHNHEHPFFRD